MTKPRIITGLCLILWVPVSIWLFLSLNAKIDHIDQVAGEAFQFQLNKIDGLRVQDSLINSHLAAIDDALWSPDDNWEPTQAELDSMAIIMERFRKELQ
jgi:hypothetical protein